MQLQDILYSQGFGTRRVCAGLIQQGFVQVYPSNEALALVQHTQSATEFVANGLRFKVQGVDWPYQGKSLFDAAQTCRHRVFAKAIHLPQHLHASAVPPAPASAKRRSAGRATSKISGSYFPQLLALVSAGQA